MNLSANSGDKRDSGSVPGSWRSPRRGTGNLLHYSCLKNPVDRGAWQAPAHGLHRVGQDWSNWEHIHMRCSHNQKLWKTPHWALLTTQPSAKHIQLPNIYVVKLIFAFLFSEFNVNYWLECLFYCNHHALEFTKSPVHCHCSIDHSWITFYS